MRLESRVHLYLELFIFQDSITTKFTLKGNKIHFNILFYFYHIIILDVMMLKVQEIVCTEYDTVVQILFYSYLLFVVIMILTVVYSLD